MNKSFKYRIYPNNSQRKQLASFFGCCRFVYNRCLEIRKTTYDKENRDVGKYELMKIITAMKSAPETVWLKNCDSMALQETIKDLDKAYKGFFDKRTDFPVFKKRNNRIQSYRTRNQNGCIRIEDDRHIVLPKIGKIYAKISRPVEGRIINATVSHVSSDKYYVSLCCEFEPDIRIKGKGKIGIDVGLNEYYTDSNGNKADNPRILLLFEKRLLREQRKLSRMIESNTLEKTSTGRPVYKRPLSECMNIQKQKRKLSSIHERIRNIRTDYLHKLSTTIIKENSFIAIENLNINGLIKNHHMSKSISDVAWREFMEMLEYKATWYGSRVVKVPTFFPSSQICSSCGYKNSVVKKLSVRQWICPKCGTTHERDCNAAKNILNKALEIAS